MKESGKTALDYFLYIFCVIQAAVFIVEVYTIDTIIFTNKEVPYTSVAAYAAQGPQAARSVYGGFDWFVFTMAYYRPIFITIPALLISFYSKKAKDTQNTVAFGTVYTLFAVAGLVEFVKLVYYLIIFFFSCKQNWFCVSLDPLTPNNVSTSFFIIILCSGIWFVLIGITTFFVIGIMNITIQLASQNSLIGQFGNLGSRKKKEGKEVHLIDKEDVL